jgi:hypothetical protein
MSNAEVTKDYLIEVHNNNDEGSKYQFSQPLEQGLHLNKIKNFLKVYKVVEDLHRAVLDLLNDGSEGEDMIHILILWPKT